MKIPKSVKTAVDDIDVIMNDKKIKDHERSKLVSVRRAMALNDQMQVALENAKSVDLGEYTITIDSCNYDPGNNVVELFGVVVMKSGVDLMLDPHRVFVNPPLLFSDDSGDIVKEERGTFRVDPAAVILNEIVEAAMRGGP